MQLRDMEDPVRFDIYAKARPHAVSAAVRVLMTGGGYASEVAARKAANHSRGEGKHALVAKGIAWSDCKEAVANAGAAFSEFVVMQEGYAPGEAANFCKEHCLYYGGSRGCHVCSGFYAK